MSEPARHAMVGREPELEALRAFLDDLLTGPSAWLIEGDPGIGKTTLWKELVDAATERGHLVLTSRPTASEAAWSFCGLGDLLRDSLREVSGDLPDVQGAALAGALLGSVTEPAPPPLAVSLATLGALRSLAASRPVVVCIDDLHMLDEPSRSALQFAFRRIDTERVGLACTLLPTTPPSARIDLMSEDRTRRLRLGPLSQESMARMLRDRVGASSLEPYMATIHGFTGGNPLHALEIGRLIASGEVEVRPDGTLPVPPSLRDLIKARLQALPEGSRETVLVAAACSAPSMAIVESVVGAGPETDAALEAAVRAEVIDVESGQIRFVHPLLGSELYASAPPSLLRSIHGALAQVVLDPEERAKHLARSAASPDAGVAATLEAAARASRRRGSPAAAAELCEAACRLTPRTDALDAARRKSVAAEYHLDAGNTARSRILLEEAISALEPGPARAAALQRLGWVRYREESWARAAELFEQALEEAGDDPALRTAIELDGSLSLLFSGDYQRSSTVARAAMERARGMGDAALESRAAALLVSVDFLMGKGIPHDVMDQALGQETWVRGGPTFEHASVAFGVLLKVAGDLTVARKRLEGAHRQIVRSGNERSLPFLLFHLAELECWSGNLALADQYARDADEAALRTGQEASRAFTLYALGLVRAHRGRETESREAIDEGLAISERSGALAARTPLISVLGFLEVSLGDLRRAHDHLAPLAEGLAATGVHEPGVLRWFGDAVEALLGVGAADQARSLVGAVERRAQDLDRRWVRCVAARCAGLLLAARDDLEAAESTLASSVVEIEALGQPLEIGRTLLALGTVRRRLKQRRSAREALERALETFEGIGAPLWTNQARDGLSRIAGRAPAPLALTPTEEKVARAVAEGATNEEVARALFMSPKTVEWNLSRIYRKVGVRSRTELARWLAAQG